MADKLGNTFDSSVLKSPLTVGRVGKEPGPNVNNVPVSKPSDPLKLIPMNSEKASK